MIVLTLIDENTTAALQYSCYDTNVYSVSLSKQVNLFRFMLFKVKMQSIVIIKLIAIRNRFLRKSQVKDSSHRTYAIKSHYARFNLT
jgi:hypothetical protein